MAELEPCSALLHDFRGQGCFSTRTSVLNTTFVSLWAGEQSWSLCCDGFEKPVWNWSSRPFSGLGFKTVRTEISRRRQRKFKYNHKLKRSLSSVSYKTVIVRSKRENWVQKVCGIAVTCRMRFQKQSWFGSSREKRSVQPEQIWPFWCSNHQES